MRTSNEPVASREWRSHLVPIGNVPYEDMRKVAERNNKRLSSEDNEEEREQSPCNVSQNSFLGRAFDPRVDEPLTRVIFSPLWKKKDREETSG